MGGKRRMWISERGFGRVADFSMESEVRGEKTKNEVGMEIFR